MWLTLASPEVGKYNPPPRGSVNTWKLWCNLPQETCSNQGKTKTARVVVVEVVERGQIWSRAGRTYWSSKCRQVSRNEWRVKKDSKVLDWTSWGMVVSFAELEKTERRLGLRGKIRNAILGVLGLRFLVREMMGLKVKFRNQQHTDCLWSLEVGWDHIPVHACSVLSDSLWPHGPYVAHQIPSMGFSREEYWCELPFPHIEETERLGLSCGVSQHTKVRKKKQPT